MLNALLVRKLVGENVNPVNFRRFGEEVARLGFFHHGRRHFAVYVRIAPGVVIERYLAILRSRVRSAILISRSMTLRLSPSKPTFEAGWADLGGSAH